MSQMHSWIRDNPEPCSVSWMREFNHEHYGSVTKWCKICMENTCRQRVRFQYIPVQPSTETAYNSNYLKLARASRVYSPAEFPIHFSIAYFSIALPSSFPIEPPISPKDQLPEPFSQPICHSFQQWQLGCEKRSLPDREHCEQREHRGSLCDWARRLTEIGGDVLFLDFVSHSSLLLRNLYTFFC